MAQTSTSTVSKLRKEKAQVPRENVVSVRPGRRMLCADMVLSSDKKTSIKVMDIRFTPSRATVKLSQSARLG